MACYRRVRTALFALIAFVFGVRFGTSGQPFCRQLSMTFSWMRRTHHHGDSPEGHEEHPIGAPVRVMATDARPPPPALVGDRGYAMRQMHAAHLWRDHIEKQTMNAIQANLRHAAATL
ncbi:MAG TPA: hypothetical protein VHE78_05955 [Gemmatimonadaceae bacterium]|nr:hypothetical protein [Gemmatimonadaceae bacterium]